MHTRNLANGMWHLSAPKGETHFLLLELITKSRETVVKDHQLETLCLVRTIRSILHHYLASSVSGQDEPVTAM